MLHFAVVVVAGRAANYGQSSIPQPYGYEGLGRHRPWTHSAIALGVPSENASLGFLSL